MEAVWETLTRQDNDVQGDGGAVVKEIRESPEGYGAVSAKPSPEIRRLLIENTARNFPWPNQFESIDPAEVKGNEHQFRPQCSCPA